MNSKRNILSLAIAADGIVFCMNVYEFAEQIVFGKTLDDKLLAPKKLTHGPRPPATTAAARHIESLISPGRSSSLIMRHDKGGNVQPPSDDRLEDETARGQLLHFLANHELLATELMALVLLKFPDAPHAFRAGVLVTLQEEQEHTRMYLRRMKECGVEFGDYPLSGQFWRVVEPMNSPLDFVSRLSLTFEQANLDYSLHFANVFKQIGDTKTATLLQKIYTDEIGHVQHGLHWFRQWKNPEQSDWEAYRESLEFPMSPQRGRGPRGAFNRNGRIQAGLTDDFIDAIEVFRQSRGRAPTVHWFDPASESELAGESGNPSEDRNQAILDQLGIDLELVMVAMSKQDDVVLVRRAPSQKICKQMIDAGFELPEFVEIEDLEKLKQRKLHDFSPWARTPDNLALVQPLESVAWNPLPPWQESTRDLFRKSWGATQLRQWLSSKEGKTAKAPDWMTPANVAGVCVSSIAEVRDQISVLASQGFSQAVFKKDLSASGRGQRRLDCELDCDHGLDGQDLKWLRSILPEAACNERLAVLEPQLDRLVDLSFLWHLLPVDIEADEQSEKDDTSLNESSKNFLGWTRSIVADGRRYLGTRLGANTMDDCSDELRKFLLADRCAKIVETAAWLESCLIPALVERKFSGYFGIDALVCRYPNGSLKIKPLVELNPRMTMGHVALELEKRVAPGVPAELRIFNRSQLEECRDQISSHALVSIGDGRWKSGVVWLGEMHETTKLIPLVLVGKELLDVAGKKI